MHGNTPKLIYCVGKITKESVCEIAVVWYGYFLLETLDSVNLLPLVAILIQTSIIAFSLQIYLTCESVVKLNKMYTHLYK